MLPGDASTALWNGIKAKLAEHWLLALGVGFFLAAMIVGGMS